MLRCWSVEGRDVTSDVLESFTARYPFTLDGFQRRAIDAIRAGRSVIVSAPTGAGKTLVAEFAIHSALARHRRIAYTTPLKALSNQKYADFCRQFGAEHVGILTGDVKVNPHAAVLVMTTEILRNMFYTGGPDGLDTVVLDECHYMGDEGRGAGRALGDGEERGRDRRVDHPRASADRGDHSPGASGAAPVPRRRSLGRGPRLGRRAAGQGTPARRGA